MPASPQLKTAEATLRYFRSSASPDGGWWYPLLASNHWFGFAYWGYSWGGTDIPVRTVNVIVPWWAVVALLALPAAIIAWRSWRVRAATRRQQNGLCPQCGYDLRASPERCPECGAVNDAERPVAG